MTRSEAKAFHDEVNIALENIFKKYNLQVRKNNVTFGDREVKLSITTEQLEEDGTHKSDYATEYLLKDYLENIGVKNLPETLIGAKFRLLGHNGLYTLTGYNTRSPKYPVEFEDEKGSRFKGRGLGIIFIGTAKV